MRNSIYTASDGATQFRPLRKNDNHDIYHGSENETQFRMKKAGGGAVGTAVGSSMPSRNKDNIPQGGLRRGGDVHRKRAGGGAVATPVAVSSGMPSRNKDNIPQSGMRKGGDLHMRHHHRHDKHR